MTANVLIPLDHHDAFGGPAGIAVESYEDNVHLTIYADEPTGPQLDRTLHPAEARLLAAVLIHHATEMER